MTDTLIRPGAACLMHGMAERLGADVVRAATSGEISPQELADMETRCGECTKHDACILWMLDHQGPQERTPDYCLNTQELNYVRAVQNQLAAE
ncbi:DUF6455 family protein [Celeribacter halophilus]|mgnify:CR=1 FL=1|uniref:DUF6455 family protein n=1 Tax=Celeribacter halophilus TaxID=576117 RepID=A0AAW7XQL3_9RHOB|nr:DUF6455 family protein [Celeribacter halophilus]MBU2891192.1 hypothetical protein [Celeribacter halophilus]MDO6456643.1 DUF6455 family protein [Celeribacter halophilus]MDO6510921.1 DUF6455 family protein [Celeribacter halophilus]MDO6723106.1 DUF6455 family protein [Celeribacter halophilus]